MADKKQNKLFGICASLGLHGLAAAILVFSLSGNTVIPRDLGKINFMWVTLAAKDQNSFSPAEENKRLKKQFPASDAGAIKETSAVQKMRMESQATVVSSEMASYDNTIASAGTKTILYAPANGQQNVSGGVQTLMTAGVVPAVSSAYPLYRENPPPGYPEMARRQGYQGVVLVAVEILTDGRVGHVSVSKSSGYAILDQTAMNAVKAWKFEPAKKSGIPYKTRAELPIKFILNDNNSQS